VVGDGPARSVLSKAYPDAVFLGSRQGEALAAIYAAADVFVFPSRTDTFGLVLLEALVGVLDEDLRLACLGALKCSRADCREFALSMTWQASARIFLKHVTEGARAWRDKPRRIAA
jgi:glycosyltransferase involved in cell wall biosynthesis